jgi:hypothetical protein
MRRKATPPLPILPLTPWLQLGTRTAEMLLASGQVIAMRVSRMAAAGASPTARDRKEFLRMGSEKVQAGAQSALAVGAQWQAIGWQLWARGWQQWMTLLGGAAVRAAPLHSHLPRLAQAALAPVHRAATANARRLSGVARERSGRG